MLTSGQYREPVTRMLELVDTLSKAAGDDAPEMSLPAWLEAIGFDVELQSTDPVLVQNSIGRIELMARMRLVGTVAAPALTGTVDVLDDGRVSIAGRSYRVRESDLRFSPDEGVIPTLRLTGETKIGDYIVMLRIEGTPDQVETTYTSDPPLGERDLRSLIITGRADTGTGSGDDQFAMTSASADVLGFAGKFVGLDSVRLGAADLELVSADVKPAQHLTVSKALNRRLEIIASQNLDENTLTWIVAWRPRSNYQLRLALRENTDYAIEFRQELDFGSGVRRAPISRARAAHTKPERITAVRVAGEAGFRDEEVLDVLELSPGDAFDVRTWIEDRARLQRFYRTRGYFGARIVPKRSEVTTPDGMGVSLDYVIHRGPQTILDISGELPGRVVEEMRAAWSSAPLTDFLVEDLVGIVRGHLVDEGYLRANVTARIAEQTTAIERVAIVVERGAKSTRRQLVFVGNEALSSAELLRFVHERDLDAAVWQDAVAFTRAVGDLYGARGFLRVVVRLGTPRYEGDLVTLPVEITEGAQAQIAAVTLSGVTTERLAGARDALGMETGSPYRRGAEGAARQRVEQYYKGLGFRDVRATAIARVATDGRHAGIDLTVQEGRRSVIASVQVTGVDSTRPGLVDRAITLRPGAPAGEGAVVETRQRLYDIGAFRGATVTFEPLPTAQATPGTGSPPTHTAQPPIDLPVNAVVALEEVRRFQLRYGIEASSEYDPAYQASRGAIALSADLRDRNVFGTGMVAGVGARYEPSLRSVRALFSAPSFRHRPVRTNVHLTVRRETNVFDDVEDRDDQNELLVEQRWRPRAQFELSWGYTYTWREVSFFVTEPTTRQTEDPEHEGVLAGLNAAAVFDFRDNPFDARRGWFHSSSVRSGVRPLGSESRVRAVPAAAVPLRSRRTADPGRGARWGSIWTFGGVTPVTALDELFKAGGTSTVRGYSEESLSALSFYGVPLGGTQLLIFNGEVRFPLFKWFGGVVFADAGNTFVRSSGMSLDDLALGMGVGLRIRTPLAPLRIDLGFPVPRRPGDALARWHFSIGQMF